MPRNQLIQIRKGTTAQWVAADAASASDPARLLAAGEPGQDTDTKVLKIGDGTSKFSDLKGYLDEDAAAAKFDGRYARPQRSSRTLIIGDSIDADAKGWWAYYTLQSKKIITVANGGVGGNRTADWLARLPALLATHKPDVVVYGGTTNDQVQVLPATTRANLKAATALIRAAGAVPVLRTTPPVDAVGVAPIPEFDTLTKRRQGVLAQNAWTRQYATSEGLEVLDIYQAVADPVTGGYQSGITSDDIHPTETGSKAIADYLMQLPIPVAFRGGFAFARAATDPTNIFVNGVFVGDSDGDGLANGPHDTDVFYPFGAGAYSITPAAAGISGNWQRVTASGSSVAALIQDMSPSAPGRASWAIGDRVAVVGRVRTSGLSAATIRVSFTGSDGSSNFDLLAGTTKAIDGVFYGEAVIPQGSTGVRFLMQNSGSAGWVEVAEAAIRNLSALNGS